MPDQTFVLPKRKSPRASWLEYNDGDYFVTVCTKEKRHYFGEIIGDIMNFTSIGSYLENELRNVNVHHPNVDMLCFVVMPNHFHAIVRISSDTTRRGEADATRQGETDATRRGEADATRRVPTCEERMGNRVGVKHETSNTVLSSFMAQLKAAVTRYARQQEIEFGWQTRYHDHCIRGTHDGNNIAQYIEHNVANWTKDCFYT